MTGGAVMLAALVLVLLSAGLGALAGRALVRRELGAVLADFERVARTAAASSGRANAASAAGEAIAAEWPALLERIENLDGKARRALLEAQDANARAIDAVQRQDELERAVSAGLAITLRR